MTLNCDREKKRRGGQEIEERKVSRVKFEERDEKITDMLFLIDLKAKRERRKRSLGLKDLGRRKTRRERKNVEKQGERKCFKKQACGEGGGRRNPPPKKRLRGKTGIQKKSPTEKEARELEKKTRELEKKKFQAKESKNPHNPPKPCTIQSLFPNLLRKAIDALS